MLDSSIVEHYSVPDIPRRSPPELYPVPPVDHPSPADHPQP